MPLTLEMDHIDGDNMNDKLENLRLLCPNCHSQTTNWRGRNIKRPAVDDQALLDALQSTSTIRAALIKVGMTPKGKNYLRASALLNKKYDEKIINTKNSQYGSVWVQKDQINKKIKQHLVAEYLDQGWSLGRFIPPNKRVSKRIPGSDIWITDGINSRMISINHPIPDGWFRGRVRNTP